MQRSVYDLSQKNPIRQVLLLLEYSTANSLADYALVSGGYVLGIVDAKKKIRLLVFRL
jgi:hypothetical protein